MGEGEQAWFISERTRALGLMHLTRRQDLRIVRGRRNVSDYLVTVTREEDEPSPRWFEVFLRGSKCATTEGQLNTRLRPAMASLLGLGQFPYPVCLWHFTMDGDQGYFTWVFEPSVVDGTPRLIEHAEAHCRKLDRATLDELVAQVNCWYDAFFATVSVKAS
jgi:hypothetical protein